MHKRKMEIACNNCLFAERNGEGHAENQNVEYVQQVFSVRASL